MNLFKWLEDHWRATLVALLGLACCLRPGWHLARRTMLQYQARNLWQMAKTEDTVTTSGQPFAWLRSKKGLNSLLVLGASEENLHSFPCWALDGAMPGESGLAMVFGHRDAHFRKLGALSLGDTLEVETKTTTFGYRVSNLEIVGRDQLHRRLNEGRAMGYDLVLITCYPFRFVGPAPRRYLVWLDVEPEVRPGGLNEPVL